MIFQQNSKHKIKKEADKEAKEALDIPGVTTTTLPYTDY